MKKNMIMRRRDSVAAFPHLKVDRYEFNKVILRKTFGPVEGGGEQREIMNRTVFSGRKIYQA